MKITIGFSRAKSPYALGSKAIQIAEKRPYSHCYVRYTHPVTGIDIISQAAHGFLNQFNGDIFKEANTIIEEYTFDVYHKEYTDMLTYIHLNLGRKYGFIQLVFIAIKKLLHIELNIHDGDKTFICSEFASRICDVLGIFHILNQDYITPSDLNKLIKGKING